MPDTAEASEPGPRMRARRMSSIEVLAREIAAPRTLPEEDDESRPSWLADLAFVDGTASIARLASRASRRLSSVVAPPERRTSVPPPRLPSVPPPRPPSVPPPRPPPGPPPQRRTSLPPPPPRSILAHPDALKASIAAAHKRRSLRGSVNAGAPA